MVLSSLASSSQPSYSSKKKSTQAQLDRMESQIAMLISILSNNSSGGFSKDIVKKYHS